MKRSVSTCVVAAFALLVSAGAAQAGQAAVALSATSVTIQQGSQITLTVTFTVSGSTNPKATPAIAYCDTVTLKADGTVACTPAQLALNAGQNYTVKGHSTAFTRTVTVVVGNDVPCDHTYNLALLFASAEGTGLDFGNGALDLSLPLSVTVTCPGALIAEGCGHGFWKNHSELWPTDYDQRVLLDFFAPLPGDFSGLGDQSLMDAMNFTGPGNTVADAGAILMQQAAAGVLNASVLGSTFAYTQAELQSQVLAALGTANRQTILTLKTALDAANSAYCPLPR